MIRSALIAAGGTGGHVYPGLAVSQKLMETGIEVHWIGTKSGLESKVIPSYDISFHTISIKGLRRAGLLRLVLAPLSISFSIFQAILIIWKVNPQVVIGMGGFVSGPVGAAAKICRRPLVVHEQNAVPGLTNLILCRIANRTLETFPGTFSKKVRAITTGNPVRSSISSILPPEKRMRAVKTVKLLVFGGSKGADILNQIVPKAIAEARLTGIKILHQCGEDNSMNTRLAYSNVNTSCEVKIVTFIEEMDIAYEKADLVISRAGATTIAEIGATGVASILVPYAYAVDDHQAKNADYLVRCGAAIMIREKELTPRYLATVIKKLLSDRTSLLTMAKIARSLGFKDSLSLVVKNCIRL